MHMGMTDTCNMYMRMCMWLLTHLHQPRRRAEVEANFFVTVCMWGGLGYSVWGGVVVSVCVRERNSERRTHQRRGGKKAGPSLSVFLFECAVCVPPSPLCVFVRVHVCVYPSLPIPPSLTRVHTRRARPAPIAQTWTHLRSHAISRWRGAQGRGEWWCCAWQRRHPRLHLRYIYM